MKQDRRYITPDEAMNLISDGDDVHTFRNSSGFLLGCDVSRKSIEQIFKDNPDKIEIGGPTSRTMKHAIVVEDSVGLLFIEHNEEKLNQFDPLTVTP